MYYIDIIRRKTYIYINYINDFPQVLLQWDRWLFIQVTIEWEKEKTQTFKKLLVTESELMLIFRHVEHHYCSITGKIKASDKWNSSQSPPWSTDHLPGPEYNNEIGILGSWGNPPGSLASEVRTIIEEKEKVSKWNLEKSKCLPTLGQNSKSKTVLYRGWQRLIPATPRIFKMQD